MAAKKSSKRGRIVSEGATPATAASVQTADYRYTGTRRVLNVPGPAISLAGRPYHLATFTVGGTEDVQQYLQTRYPPRALTGDFQTGGHQFFEGAVVTRQTEPLQGLIDLIVHERGEDDASTAPSVKDCTRAELVTAINLFFEYAGLAELERLMLSFGRALRAEMQKAINAEAAGIVQAVIADAKEKGTIEEVMTTALPESAPTTGDASPTS